MRSGAVNRGHGGIGNRCGPAGQSCGVLPRCRSRSGHWYLLLSVLLLAIAWPGFSGAQGVAMAAEPGSLIETAPVVIDGKTLFRVRGVSAFTAEARASAIAARIRDIASDKAIEPITPRIETVESRSSVYVGDRIVVQVLSRPTRSSRGLNAPSWPS